MNSDEEEMIEFDMETMEMLSEILSCGICYDIFDKATALMDCLHIFCWKCINEKITQGDLKCCPVCFTDTGPNPVEKLRRAHSLEKFKDLVFGDDDEEDNEEMKQESTEGLETESLVPSSIAMEDVKPVVPIKAQEDEKKFLMKTEIAESSVKIELPSVSQDGEVVRIAAKS
ncbi:hypothetical protein AALP_AAs74268U000100, partial [Arabis alpina]